jgi:hypothetical protein
MVAAGQASPPAASPPPAAAPAASTPADIDEPLAEIRVEGSRPPEPLNPITSYDADFVTRSQAMTADEAISLLPESLAGTTQMVFINGQETTDDVSSIPAARIERIEVNTAGIRPDGRPRIVGTVINVILKQQYTGANIGARARVSAAGGGEQRQLNSFDGYAIGRLSGVINVIHREQDALTADQRPFSRIQDQMPRGGADYRVPYGTALVVESLTGPLNGVRDANGLPTAIALASPSSGGQPLVPADFTGAPAGTVSAAGLTHYNTSPYLYLVAPARSDVVNTELTFALTPRTKLHAGFTYSRSQSEQSGPPPVTPASPTAVVPAADSPFGQSVEVGLVHAGFGPVHQTVTTARHAGFLAADGGFGTTWTWNGRLERGRRGSMSATRDLDATKFAASLAAADPAQRFDPFADTGPGSANAALYPDLTSVRTSGGAANDTLARAEARGQVGDGWVAPLYLHLGIEDRSNDSNQHVSSDDPTAAAFENRSRLSSRRYNVDLDVPSFKTRPSESPAMLTVSAFVADDLQHLDQLAAGTPQSSRLAVRTTELNTLLDIPWRSPGDGRPGIYQLQTQMGIGVGNTEGESVTTGQAGGVYSPVKWLALRAEYARQLTPPPLVLYPLTVSYDQTLVDRLRGNVIASNVEVIGNQPQAPAPPRVNRLRLTAEWQPRGDDGGVGLTYEDVEQKGQQRTFSAQDILDNEAALVSRVVRMAASAADLALGEPGPIEAVDITPFSGGQREDTSLTLFAHWTQTSQKEGTFTLRAMARHLLRSRNELTTGTEVVSTSDQEMPPAWNASTQLQWRLRKWDTGLYANYAGRGSYAGLPFGSFATVDLRLSYQFDHPWGGRLGRLLRVGASVQNVAGRDPPFANTINGFRGGSPLGRLYELQIRSQVGD